MPPVSVTMQARNLPPPAAAPVLDDVDVVGVELVVELPDDPQAAASSVTAAKPAAIRIFALKLTSSGPGAPDRQETTGLIAGPPAGLGRESVQTPPGLPEG